jgi:hypothetical protein
MVFRYILAASWIEPREFYMFSSLFEKKRIFFLLAAFLAALALFSACVTDEDPILDGAPVGTWVSSYGETYVIGDKNSELKKFYGGDLYYSGTITGFGADGWGNGYITIKYTQKTSYDTDGNPSITDVGTNEDKYYVIHWKGLRAGSVELSDAYGSKGDEFQQSELSEITVANGYFNAHSACVRQ